MLRMGEKKRGFSVERVWFWQGETQLYCKADVVRYLRVTPSEANALRGYEQRVYTLVSDLKSSVVELMGSMRKSYRYEIRRAEREEIEISFYDAEALRARPSVMADFEHTYMRFCDTLGNKALKKDLDRKKIQSYIEKDCILLTAARALTGGGAVFHLYVTDGRWAVLCHSASDFREKEVDAGLAGRANKLLHWRDMLKFKQDGCELYDWGNLSDPAEYNGIDSFKAGFGGKPQLLYNIAVGNSLRGKAIVGALCLYRRFFGGRV